MAIIDDLIWSPLMVADVDDAVCLNEEAGWNQIAADWLFMLDHGEGTGVRSGGLVATSILMPQGDRFAWIAMILVTSAWQRRGLAGRLMRSCMDRAHEMDLVAGLDATEAGRPIYLSLGFKDIYPLSRWQADVPGGHMHEGVRFMEQDDLDTVATFDQSVAGADRWALLKHLRDRCPERALVLEQNGELKGFVLARNGRLAVQIGPLSARSQDDALTLLDSVLSQGGPAYLDAADHQRSLAMWLIKAGFSRQRGYMRMLLKQDDPVDVPAQVFLIAGPELG